jgi:two-component system sensor histidine kinase HydH
MIRKPMARVIIPTAVMSILLLLVGGVAAWYLHQLQQDSVELLVASVAKVEAAEELEVISHEFRYQLRQYDADEVGSTPDAIANLWEKAHSWLSRAREMADSDQERDLIRKMEQGYTTLFEEFSRLREASHDEGSREHVFNAMHDMAADEILEPAQAFRDLTRQHISQASRRNQALADRMGLGLLLLGACGAVAGLLTGYGIARGIDRSLAQLTIPIRNATGKLDEVVGPLTVSSGDTFEDLESALQGMANQVGTVVQQLQESQMATIRAQQLAAMGQLAAGLAHELRNPLTSMKMLVQPSETESDEIPLDARDLGILREEIDRLESTIRTFLDYARPPRLEKRSLFMRDILRQTVEFFSRRAKQRGVTIDLEVLDQPILVDADAGQIRQVLLNLLLNALDAAPEGTAITVCLSHEFVDRQPDYGGSSSCPSGWTLISVADRGAGLPDGMAERIFEPFVSLKEGGTGLGLPICKRIVEDHGGTISSQAREGGGAVFTIRLPIAATPETLIASPDGERPAARN